MSRPILFTLLVMVLAAILLPEIALANKFTTIGGGVSGEDSHKLGILKQIASYAGLFFILLGILSLLTRSRFEGFVGMQKKGAPPSPAPYVLIGIGALLTIFFFV
ncbi:hypothetical protein [Sedimenticola selenatireducens]|uniref:Uncharacterized protein n=1 Tax=Sedimenticola selenatireducens TaxID=191960 RepID=A0A557S1Z1_9GAMM|nr:hypothetical protein [Sedimenticola selenatireducens]TVO71441.1 hypothetical protein FHP88_14055 [Sedimenticola selenatireducens]TVT66130.1 MAG: hypothetical protein FHK78_02490 [Sedimenticola selenatireducens]